MPVETIECQIVQGQLGRYLAGDSLPAETVRDMETHISGCPICRDEVARRRATLRTLLGNEPIPGMAEANPLLDLLRQRSSSTMTMPTHAVTPHLAEPASATPSDKTPDVTPTPRRILSKPLILSGALAVVLIAMNTFVKSPTSFLGPRAASSSTAPAADSTPKTTLITSSAASTPDVDDRLFRADWELFAFADMIDFDVDLSDTLPAWRWLALDTWTEAPADDTLEESADEAALNDQAEPEMDAIEAWEVFAVADILAAPAEVPTENVAPRRSNRPRPSRPAVNREAAPRTTPTTPNNSIRVYEPESQP